MNNILNTLVQEHGQVKVAQAAKQLLDQEQKKKAGNYHSLVSPDKLAEDLQLYHNALLDISAAGKAVEETYKNKSSIVKQLTQINTSIELTEAEAFMQLEGNKVEVDGKIVTLSNDKMRDMYRKYTSRAERKRLAELEADLKEIEIETFKAKDRWEEAKLSAEMIKSRAYVQANLLHFLS